MINDVLHITRESLTDDEIQAIQVTIAEESSKSEQKKVAAATRAADRAARVTANPISKR